VRPVLALALAALPLLAQAQAQAQAPRDDWEIKRSPFDPRVVARYEAALERDPDDPLALRKLVELYRKYRSIDELLARWKARRSWQAQAVYSDLLAREAGRSDEALVVLAGAPGGHPPIDTRIGNLERKLGRPAEARAAYERALAKTPDGPAKRPLVRSLAELALAAHDLDAARRYYDQLVALDPQNLKLHLEYADALEKNGQPRARVVEELERADKIVEKQGNPQLRAEVLARLGETYEADGQDDRAVATYRKGIALLPREHYLRRELVDKIVGVYRHRDRLRELAQSFEKEWTQKGFAEWEVLARLYDELGEQEKAENAFRKAIAAQPQALEARTRYIALLERLGRDDEVVREYEKLIALAPGEPKFQLALAERLLRRGDKKRGMELLRRLSARFGGDSGVHAALAELFDRYGESDLALRENERLVALEPDDEGHLIALGEQWFQRGNKKKAQEIWRRLLNLSPRKEQALAHLAEIYADHDMPQEALELYDRALRLAPRDPAIRRGIAQVLERQRRVDEAVMAWEKVMELASDAASRPLRREARSRIIGLLAKERRLAARLGPYQTRFSANPADLEAGYFLAEAYTRLGQLEAAERVLRQILTVAPGDVDALGALVQVLRGRHRLTDAIATLRRLAELQPARAREYYAQIAELSLLLYRDDEAVAFARRAVELAPNDAPARLRLAEIFEKRDDLPQAIESYRAALAQNPRLWKAQFALARLLIRGGQLKQAALVYREVLARAAEDEIVLDAAHRAIDLEEYLGTLGELDRELVPLEFAHQQKPIYRKVLLELYARYAPPLVERAAAADATARTALRGLGEHGLRPLLEALDEPDSRGQSTAARILGYLGNRAAAPALARIAGGAPSGDPPQKPDIEVRVAATLALGRLLGEGHSEADRGGGDHLVARVVPQLVRLLGDRELALREAAAWSLGRTPDAAAARALIAATGDGRAEVGALACLALSGQHEAQVMPHLVALVRDSGRDDRLRAGCAQALGRLGGGRTAAAALTELIENGSGEAQRAAAWALGLGDVRPVIRQLVHAVFERRGPVREAALLALCGPAQAPPLPDLEISEGKPDVGAYLDRVLDLRVAGCASPRVPAVELARHAQAPLLAALGRHRDLALRALTDLDAEGDGLALGPFGPLPESREIALALAPALSGLSTHADPEVRLHAMRLLAKLGDPAAEAAIVRAVADPDLALADAAAGAAHLYADRARAPTAIGQFSRALAGRLHAPGWPERVAAARALAADRRLAAAAFEALAEATHEDNGFVREAVCTALGRSGEARARPLLQRLEGDLVPAVREAATRALRTPLQP
jgi:tetratricopeptide (TPR) repeat protein